MSPIDEFSSTGVRKGRFRLFVETCPFLSGGLAAWASYLGYSIYKYKERRESLLHYGISVRSNSIVIFVTSIVLEVGNRVVKENKAEKIKAENHIKNRKTKIQGVDLSATKD